MSINIYFHSFLDTFFVHNSYKLSNITQSGWYPWYPCDYDYAGWLVAVQPGTTALIIHNHLSALLIIVGRYNTHTHTHCGNVLLAGLVRRRRRRRRHHRTLRGSAPPSAQMLLRVFSFRVCIVFCMSSTRSE